MGRVGFDTVNIGTVLAVATVSWTVTGGGHATIPPFR